MAYPSFRSRAIRICGEGLAETVPTGAHHLPTRWVFLSLRRFLGSYRGTPYFLRVKHPQPGDLVVWPGHVGIIVSPARHTFFSALSHGPETAEYDARYWKRRGPVRFYRYIDHQPSQAVFRPE